MAKVSEAQKNSGHRRPPPYHPIILEVGSFSKFYYNASHQSDSAVSNAVRHLRITRRPAGGVQHT